MNSFAVLIFLSSFWASTKIITSQEYPINEKEIRDAYLQSFAEETPWCLGFLNYGGTIDIAQACLNTFQKMSFMAEALFIRNYTSSLVHVNATKLVTLSQNVAQYTRNDWIIAAVCLTLMPDDITEVEIDIAVRIAGGLMKSFTHVENNYRNSYPEYIFRLAYRKFERIFESINHSLVVVTSNLAIVTWYPFQSHFNGIAWYKGNNSTDICDYIKKLSRNWTIDSVSKDNLKMVVYVPQDFLEDLLAQSKLNKGQDIFIGLTIAKENYFLGKKYSEEVYDTTSIRIPGFCKRNELPILKVLYEDDARVYEHGNKYFDSSNGLYHCTLSTTLHFAKVRNNTSFFESIKAEYCLRYPIGETYFPQTLRGYGAYPEDFCVNGHVEIPYIQCSFEAVWVNDKSMELECKNNFSTSAHTHQIYKLATECWNVENFGDFLITINSTNLDAIDKRMLYDMLNCIEEFLFARYSIGSEYIRKNNDTFFDGINLALAFSRELPKEFLKASKMHGFLVLFTPSLGSDQIMVKADDNYIYQNVPYPSSFIGIVVYKRGSGFLKSYEVKLLTKDNITANYVEDQSVEVIIYITNGKQPPLSLGGCSFSVLITRPSLYPENDTVSVKSKSLVISSCVKCELRAFLRVTDNENNWRLNRYTGEGYWFEALMDTTEVVVAYISENTSHNYCESIKNIEMKKYIPLVATSSFGRIIIHKIDLLSMLSMSVNNAENKTGTEDIYDKYSSLLTLFRMVGSTLSLLGIIILFTTALVLKNWRKTRFYTIQLTITLTFQIILLIVETQIGEIPQILFFIFYYSILSQFCWMGLIGYVQYLRYIKIFGSKKLGIVKSLIIGWLFPAVIIAVSLLFYVDCLKCNVCYKSKDIFIFFVLVPVGLIVVINLIVYVAAMTNIWSNQSGESLASERKLKTRASIFLPFLMGVTWILVFALVSPWSWLFVAGLFFIHLILPSQAMVLCIFVVLLDKPTRQQWKAQIRGILKKRQ